MGFAASSFLKLLDEEDPTHQYQIYGRYRVGSGWRLRAAARYRQRIQDNSEIEVGLRAGLDHRFRASGAWRFYGGADLIGAYAQEANGDVVYRAGVAPVLGALVYLTPHVSLSVEPRLVALYNRYQQSTLQGDTPETVTLGIEGVGLLIVSVHF